MSKKPKQKFYVVWKGRRPGVYTNWTVASEQVTAYPGAEFKSFPTLAQAGEAYRGRPSDYIVSQPAETPRPKPASFLTIEAVSRHPFAMAVDAACSGVPGPVEYRGVMLATAEQLFAAGPFEDGTNNIGEYLALVHGLALLAKQGHTDAPVYSDSRTAIAWVRARKCRTKMERTGRNARLFELIARADAWLGRNPVTNPVLKWETEAWGEIPADYGRK